MRIAILSDAHDHIENVRAVMVDIAKRKADVLLFCGDFCAPGPARIMSEFAGPIHTVFGNNDGDRLNISGMLSKAKDATVHKEYAELLLDSKRIGMTHYPFYADKMAKSGDFDLVCFGHDHQQRVMEYGQCLAVNPGSLNAVRDTDILGFAMYDTQTHVAELIKISEIQPALC